MAFEGDINEIKRRTVDLTFLKDEQAGQFQGDPILEVIPEGMANLSVNTIDQASGKLLVNVDHNGSAMDGVDVDIKADVDLGDGVVHRGWRGTFNMKAALGADAVTAVVGPEIDITPTPV